VQGGIMDKQRIYDAMLIKAFRSDIRMTDLEKWLAPYDIKLMESKLKRIPKKIWWVEKVRVVVANNMRPLSDRLWDTDRSKDIETLNWMANINCSNPSYDKVSVEKQRLKKKSNADRQRNGFLFENWESQKRTNQWSVTK
jgi:hypothetical protein